MRKRFLIEHLLGIYKRCYLIKAFQLNTFLCHLHLILKSKTYFLVLFDFAGGGVLGVLGICLSSLLGGGGVEAVLGILFSINLSFPII